MSSVLSLSPHKVVNLSAHKVKGKGLTRLNGRFQSVYGQNWTVYVPEGGFPPDVPLAAAPFDFADWDYPTITGVYQSAKRFVQGIGCVDISEYTQYSLEPTSINADGSWDLWPLWHWAWSGYQWPFDPNVNRAQAQLKVRLVGPAKGYLVTYPDRALGDYQEIDGGDHGDPVNYTDMVPSSAIWKELRTGEEQLIEPVMPAVVERPYNGCSVTALMAWRFGDALSLTPNTCSQNTTMAAVLRGIGFVPGYTLVIGGVNIAFSSYESISVINMTWQANSLGPGVYDLVYTGTDGIPHTLVGALTITP